MHKNKLIIGLVVLLTISTFAFIGCKIGNKVYNTVSPLPIATPPVPTPKSLKTRVINGNEYTLQRENINVPVSDIFWGGQPIIDTGIIPPWGGNRLTDFWFDPEKRILFTVDSPTEPDPTQRVTRYEILPHSIQTTVLYSDLSAQSELNILDYYNQNSTLLMKTFGGDGCSWSNEVWTLKGSNRQVLKAFGGACDHLERPLYVGYWNGKIVAASRIDGDPISNSDEDHSILITRIFLIDPFTMKEETVASTSTLPNPTTQSDLGYEEQNSGVVTIRYDQGLTVVNIDLQTHKITSSSNPSQ